VSSTAAASSDYDFSPGLPLLERPSRARRARQTFTRYLIAICIGVAATLAWQSYGDVVKQTVAIKAPELGWSPEVQQLIAASLQQLGWTKAAEQSGAPPTAAQETAQVTAPPAAVAQQAPVAQAAPEPAVSAPPAAPSPTLEQVQQIASDLTALKQAVQLLASNQDQMAQDLGKVQATDQEVLNKVSAANKAAATNAANNKAAASKVPAPAPQSAAMPTHKHPSASRTSALPMPPAPPPAPYAPAPTAPASSAPIPPAPVPPQPLPLR
jgi:hypothetical protein